MAESDAGMGKLGKVCCARPDGIRGKVKISLFPVPPSCQISSIIFVPWKKKKKNSWNNRIIAIRILELNTIGEKVNYF